MLKLMHTENIYHPFHFLDLLLLFYLSAIPEINLLYEVYNPLDRHFQT